MIVVGAVCLIVGVAFVATGSNADPLTTSARKRMDAAISAADSSSDASSAAAATSTRTELPPGASSAVTGSAASVEQPVINGQAGLVLHPVQPNGRLVLYLHGTGQLASSLLTDEQNAPQAAALLGAGYTVAGSDAHGDAWGNPDSVKDYLDLLGYARQNATFTSLYLLAESAGGIAGLELLNTPETGPVAGFAGIYPVCSLGSITSLSESIHSAWGFGTNDAIKNLSPPPITGAVPMLLWASPEDTVVPKAQNADLCASTTEAGGGNAEVIATHGEHGDVSNFDSARLIEFFDANGS